MIDTAYLISSIVIMALVTAALRFAPFVIFGGKHKTPRVISVLGSTLPCAVMSMLVVYCLRNTTFSHIAGFAPELIAALVVVLLHIWKRNVLLSIVGGTLCYMVLVQSVFV